MNKNPTIAVLYHLFYEDSCEIVCKELEPLLSYNTIFLFNICGETPDRINISAALRSKFPSCWIICTSNKGKDIGAKLALLQLYLQLPQKTEYLIFLHDKKSLQALKSASWKKDLLKIISPTGIQKAIQIFQENLDCGIIASEPYIIKETYEDGQFTGVNGSQLAKLNLKYQLKTPSWAYVAGTMFWVRAKPVHDFFKLNNPLEIRKELEDGNVLDNFSGTVTHSWERLFIWIITGQHYSIKGI